MLALMVVTARVLVVLDGSCSFQIETDINVILRFYEGCAIAMLGYWS